MSYKKKSKTDNFKILLLGDSGVGNLYLKLTFPGKSCTLIQLIVLNKKTKNLGQTIFLFTWFVIFFLKFFKVSTIGSDYKNVTLDVNNKKVNVSIWGNSNFLFIFFSQTLLDKRDSDPSHNYIIETQMRLF
jgi:GTPase SAR1 family protein